MRKTLSAVIVIFAVALGSAQMAGAATPPKKASAEDQQMAQLTRELGLTKKQSDSIRSIMNKVEADMRKVMQSKDSNESKAKKRQAIAAEAQTKFLAVLTPAQRKKLTTMMQKHPAPGPRPSSQSERRGMSYVDAVNAALKSAGLSTQQESKTDSIMKDFWKKRTAIRQDKKLTDPQKKSKLRSLKEQTLEEIGKVLTSVQRKKFGEQVARLGQGARQ